MNPLTDRGQRRDMARVNRERKLERRRYLEARVRALHAEGLPTRSIATRLQVGIWSVVDAMHRIGLTPPGRDVG